jgi:Tfp pilus assembly major pilin PilA
MMDQLKLARIKTGAFNLGDYMDAAGIAAIEAELAGNDA